MSITDHLCGRCIKSIMKVGGRVAYIPKGRVIADPHEASRLRAKGLTINDIAKHLGVGDRRVYQLLAAG